MKNILVAVFAVLLFTSYALAADLDISISSDKHVVFYGENFTLSGNITRNDTGGTFDYRVAAVAPPKVIICDSGKMTTTDGTFSFTCKTPTMDEAKSLNISAADRRLVIPIVSGIAVNDTADNKIVKKHAKLIFAVNREKIKARLLNISEKLDGFAGRIDEFILRLDNATEKAHRFNLTQLVDKINKLKGELIVLKSNLTTASDRASQLANNINSLDFEQFTNELRSIGDSSGALRNRVGGILQDINNVRWENFRERVKRGR